MTVLRGSMFECSGREIETMKVAGSSDGRAAREHSAPARVNLIGEHTDYTGGLVMPMAIPFETVASIEAAEDGSFHFVSDSFAGRRSMAAEDRSGREGDWSDYPVGVLRQMQAAGIVVPPFTLRLRGNVPLGSGLSSSASVEVATAMALLDYAGVTMATAEIALMCQRAENDYVGSPCGIMDQFVVTAGVRGHALLLNTRDLTSELLPMNQGQLAGCKVVVANSGVRHSIAGGDYGLRRRELEAGQAVVLRRFPDLLDLGDAELEQLTACEASMTPESFRRCRHVVTENARVREAREAMYAGDAVRLGRVMTDAHASERDDFQCSVAEIDFLVETAIGLDGCHGARLTGGGFGGCTVNLVDGEKAGEFVRRLGKAYQERYRIAAEIYVCEAVDGAVARAAGGRVAA